MIDVMALTPQDLERFIHMQGIVARQDNTAARVRALREYYAGEHPIMLTKRQQEYLGELVEGEAFTFAHNLVRSIIDTLRERLDVSGFTVNGQGVEDADLADQPEPDAQLAALMWDWWMGGKLDSAQITLYRRALRDGKAYVIVDWDAVNAPEVHAASCRCWRRTTRHHHAPRPGRRQPRFVRYQVLLHVRPAESWHDGTAAKDRLCRVKSASTSWRRRDSGSRTGTMAMRHGRCRGLMGRAHRWAFPLSSLPTQAGSEIDQIIGLQNALNKTWLDLIAAADASGFPSWPSNIKARAGLAASRMMPDIEGNDEFRFAPGRAIEVDNANVKRLDAANLQPMIETMWTIVQAISGVSRTPAYYLRPVGGGDVPSGEALKQLESGLVKRAQERQLIFGQAWADAFAMAYAVSQTFGPSLPDLPEMDIQTVWTDASVRNELSMAQVGQIYKQLNVPDDTIWQYVLALRHPRLPVGVMRSGDDAVKLASVADALRRSGVAAQRPADSQPQPAQPAQQNGGNEQ